METNNDALDDRLAAWLERDPDPASRDELSGLRDADEFGELSQRFGGRLQFGTAGLRGLVGAGPMRMNRLVIRETSAGLGNYLLAEVADATERGVVIAYDARPDSHRFARDAASVFLGLGFRIFFTETAQPTPLGAYGVLEFGAAAGVVVTASHNPPEYNGYKVYWENGTQIIPPHDAGIAACIETASAAEIPWAEFDEGVASGRVQLLGNDFTAGYRSIVLDYCSSLDRAAATERIGVAYTAMHGVGGDIARALLDESGLCDFATVASQHEPDGTFPTVAFPNPEEPGAMDAVIELARKQGAMLACANDPDADRLAVAVRAADGSYEMLTGDQIGILLGNYCLSKPRDYTAIVCASIVSSRMLKSVADEAGADYFETLTGFKWLSNVALEHEEDGKRFLFAYEEALGYALGQLVRDKDGLSALLLFAKMTAEAAARGDTVQDILESLYRRHGLFVSEQKSIATRPGAASITDKLRSANPVEIAGRAIESVKDLRTGTHSFADGRTEAIVAHPSDVLMYYLEDQSRVIVRPSGTEPKTKCYYEVIAQVEDGEDFLQARKTAESELAELVRAHQATIEDNQ